MRKNAGSALDLVRKDGILNTGVSAPTQKEFCKCNIPTDGRYDCCQSLPEHVLLSLRPSMQRIIITLLPGSGQRIHSRRLLFFIEHIFPSMVQVCTAMIIKTGNCSEDKIKLSVAVL